MRPVFGEVVTASDVERLTSEQDERAFVRLCATLVASAAGEMVGDFAVPNWTERINVADRGVDAEYTAPTSILESGGLLGPGRNVYQVKWRRLGTRPARSVIQEFRKAVTGGLKDLVSRNGSLPDRYVLLVNLDLSRADRETLAQALRKDCPEFTDRPLIIWGAAEIAAALNSHPHVRHAFFSEGIFCTLDTALDELRRRYEAVGWSEFVGYEEHLRAIRDFVTKTSDRLLVVTGLAYSGKTRTVIEALRRQEARIVWASDPDVVTDDHFRVLDSGPGSGLVVVDNCETKHLEALERRARSRTNLRTILISRRTLSIPDVPQVRLEGLSHEGREALFRQVGQKIPYLMRDWISRLAGSNPGLILYGLAAQRDMPEHAVLSSERKKPRQVIGSLLRNSLLANLPADELDTLQILAIIPQVGTEDDKADELAGIAAVLNRDQLKLRQVIPRLVERHLLLRRGRFVQVVPELLANDVAAEVFKASPDLVTELWWWWRLNPFAQDRLLKRLLDLSEYPAIGSLLDEILSGTGWFRTLEDLRNQARRFRTLAEARPQAAIRALQRLLGGLDVSTLRDSVDGELRREVVWSLEALALRTDTFSGAGNLLLRLAEAENENVSNNATGVFLELFHWRHPQVSAPHSERVDFLERTAHDPSSVRRILAAKAAGQAVVGRATFSVHHREDMSPPEGPAAFGTWGDVWQFHESILMVLQQLAKDPEEEVAATAYQQVLGAVRETLRLSILKDGLHPLAHACFETLIELARSDLGLGQRSELRSALDLIAEGLRRRMDEAAQKGRPHVGVALAQARLDEVRNALVDESFAGKLKRWVGPRSWGDRRVDMRAMGQREGESSAEHIACLAAEAWADPMLLTDTLVDWLMTDEARHSAAFFMALGLHDLESVWCGPIVERLGRTSGPRAFGWYVAGVAKRDRTWAEDILDHVSLETPKSVEGFLAAVFLLPAADRSVQRLLSLVDRGLTSASEVLNGIQYGGWVKSLSLEAFTGLTKRLDDGTVEAATGLLELLASRLLFSEEMPEELQEKAWSLLERSAQNDDRSFADSWDQVAAWLAARQPQRFFGLLEQLPDRTGGLQSVKTLSFMEEHARVWKKLGELDRERLILSLLRLELREEEDALWVSRCLEHVVDPDADKDILLSFASANGEKGALAVADLLDASSEAFWDIAGKLIERFPESERLESRLGLWVGTSVEFVESLVAIWRDRLDRATKLLNHPHPRVSRWARQVVDWMEENIRREEKEDQERFIWDYRISRRQLEGLLKERESPDRLWAIRRILKRAPTKDVLELLTPEDIKEGLSKVDLPEEERKKWEAYIAHWSHRG